MKKFYLATFAVIATVILAACGGNKQADQKEDKEITVAVQLESSKDILEIAKKEAEKKGYKINIMEVSDKKKAVAKFEIVRRNGQQDTRHATYDESEKKAQRPKHRRRIDNPATEYRKHPVEDFHAGRHRDDHRRDTEGGIHIGSRAHGEKMMQPDREG